jgi:two-component system chemotaxis sensor kinase CheA
MQDLAALLADYQDGDLVIAAQIIELSLKYATDDSLDSDTRSLVESIGEQFVKAAQGGDSGELLGNVEKWQRELLALDGAAHSDATPPEAHPEAAGAEPAQTDAEDLAAAEQPESMDPDSSADTQQDALGDTPTEISLEDEDVTHEVPVDDLDIVTSFLQEADDHLDDIESRVLKLEKEYSADLVNTVFRSLHTIKGVAGFVGFTYVQQLSHELEALLDDVRNGERNVTEELVTVLLDGSDIVGRIAADISAQVHAAADKRVTKLHERSFGHSAIVDHVKRMRDAASGCDSPEETDQGESTATTTTNTATSPGGALPAATNPIAADAPVVTPEMMDAFVEESSDLLDRVEQALLQAENDPVSTSAVDQVFRDIHTIKGNAGFFWFAKVEQRCMAMESALDAFRKTGTPIDHAAATEFLEMLDAIRKDVTAVEEAAAASDAAAVAAQQQPDEIAPGYSDALGEILLEMGALNQEELDAALSSQHRRLGEILVSDQHVPEESVKKALDVQTERRALGAGTPDKAVHRKDIRVDTNKLDKLFELVGELITAESMVVGNINGNGTSAAHEDDDAARSVQKAASYLQKITREMQEITLSIRMIPLEATFGKMRRLVRDLARKFEKKVNIEISGEETEMDKNVIEEISDPLVHIIRNAVDHGIESPAERLASGKPETGTIWLSARHEGNEIWITVQDDGGGLHRDRILKKAAERGLIQEGDPEPTDEEVWRFVFEPAFSTASAVSEISGRGVGMDVVKQNIEKLRGKIDVKSQTGGGTTFVLRIPLTLAILDGVTFTIGSTQYSVPTSELVTFQRYTTESITHTSASHYGFRHRDEVIPIIQYERRGPIPEHGVIIVVHSNGMRAALAVDEIVGYRQFVVRSMPEYIQNMRAVSGCSIQGDGSISFIIDVGELMAEELANVGSR